MSRVRELVLARSGKSIGVPSISEDGTFITAPLSWLPWLTTQTTGVVTEEGSLALPTIYACVRVISEDVASLPFMLYRRLPGGGKERATDHPLYSVLHDSPNPAMTSLTWRETLMTHVLTWGNHYSEIVEDAFGRVQLWPLQPSKMTVKWEDNRKTYYYGDEQKKLEDGTVFHVMGQSLNGLVGLSPIALHRATLGEQTATREFGRNFYRNNARPATVLKHPKSISAPAQERLKAQMEDLKGSRNAGKTVLLEEDMDFKEIGIPPEDAQYIETRKFQREEAAALYRMPQHKVGIMEHATFSNIEHQAIDYVTGTLRPWLVRLEQAAKMHLFSEQPDIFAELLVDGLLRGDAKSRAEALDIRRRNGTLNADQWRDLENENPLPDGTGQAYWMPVNYREVGDVAEPPPDVAPEDEPMPSLVAVKSAEVRCQACGRKVADMATPPYRFTCRCKAVTEAAA